MVGAVSYFWDDPRKPPIGLNANIEPSIKKTPAPAAKTAAAPAPAAPAAKKTLTKNPGASTPAPAPAPVKAQIIRSMA